MVGLGGVAQLFLVLVSASALFLSLWVVQAQLLHSFLKLSLMPT